MAPSASYRNANRRQNRPGLDHGEFEGIPVRYWSRDYVTVAPPPNQDSATNQNDIWAVELPHGMPKDSHLLPQHSQDLLRAARAGKIYKRPAPADEEEADPEAIVGEKSDKKDDDILEKGFTVKSWKLTPRHLEGPDVSYLAKRRPGLGKASLKSSVPVATVIKATVKRIDAAGNEYVQDVVVPQGQTVEGEVLSQTQIPDPNAPVDMTAAHATPPKRRPATKRKAKGPGRGRKKKPAAPTSVPLATPIDGPVPNTSTEGTVAPENVKNEGSTSTPTVQEDIEMGDGSQANSDDEDGDDGDEGDEGEDDEASDDMQDSVSKAPQQSSLSELPVPSMPPIPPLELVDSTMGGTEINHAPPRLLADKVEGKSGSPLRQVAMTTSTAASPLESSATPFQNIAPTEKSESLPSVAEAEALDSEMQQQASETAPTSLPSPPPKPTMAEVEAAVNERREEEEEEQMLLDIADKAKIGAPVSEGPPVSAESEQGAKATPPEQASVSAAAEDDDDNYPDLLGGLEESLKTPQTRAETSGAPKSPEKVVIDEEGQEEGANSQDSEMLL
ncbi:hypothetical protein LZ554_005679 [Drepanopeziza brunnea f. sp. 'monogermtubi']|nr:hypothetical protein LZ554_005679 [Drepanopeziza brunnea f. sp. 'monogermtubi']